MKKLFALIIILLFIGCSDDPASPTIEGCDGVQNSGLVFDDCGVCDGNNACLDPMQCDLNPSDFEHFMTLTAGIDFLIEEQNFSDTLFAYVEESCRGQITPMLELDNYVYYLMIFGDSNGDSVDFYYFQSSTDLFWKLDQSVSFINGESLGNPLAPFIFTNESVQE